MGDLQQALWKMEEVAYHYQRREPSKLLDILILCAAGIWRIRPSSVGRLARACQCKGNDAASQSPSHVFHARSQRDWRPDARENVLRNGRLPFHVRLGTYEVTDSLMLTSEAH